MSKNGFLGTLIKLSGRDYTADPAIPDGVIFDLILRYGIDLLRGLIRFQKKVFIGARVSIRNKAKLSLGTGVKIGRDCSIDALSKDGVILGNNVSLGHHSDIITTGHLSHVGKGLKIGDNTGIGPYAHIGSSGGVSIGENCIMGHSVSFHAQDHVFDDTKTLIKEQGVTEKGIAIGDDCWIGAKATFLDGARIGKHCVVAAGAVVKGEFPDHVVVGGIPAKIIKKLP